MSRSNGTADQIIRAVCNEYRNSDLRADNPEIRHRLNERFADLERKARALELLAEAEGISVEEAIAFAEDHPARRHNASR